ncbi:MAG TPA: isoprenylcysteine carboxylmethyltransferase family protein [Candidatus Paceibacterota bacterium]|nr:isoprenylcysteine carboxylmethyltransferase family protein [Verrucomicrobiota bacterium]HRY48487.1 isoprenylcysteine carboxylmethyltransferase family protein [Candidatus Paceibacterota bacterium]HSA03902.1 isoprenylcysteine carboxylmethyltransferase family protein [Candidatus Paceibacterota bacterium]
MITRFIERGGLWVAVQSVLMLGVFGLSLIYPADTGDARIVALGIVFLASGACFGLAGALALKKNLTPYPAPLPHVKLVRQGIYARVRHPLYTSVILASLGWALVCQSWPGLIAACVLIPFFMAKADREEHWLMNRFPEYADYAKTTRRFIPWLY